MTFPNTSFPVGALVYFHGHAAVVTALSADKIGIRAEDGSTKNVRPKDIVKIHPGPVSRLPLPPPEKTPDWQEILELVEGETLPFAEFTELACGSFSPEAAWCVWQECEKGIFFTGDAEKGITPRSPGEIAEKLAKLREKNAAGEARKALLQRIREGQLLPEDRKFFREVEAVALGTAETSSLMKDLEVEATPEKAHKLLLNTGLWDLFRNPWPSRLGVETSTPSLALETADDTPREDLTAMRALAIDDEGSNDPDDAISFADGVLYVHVADVTAVLPENSPASAEAAERGANLYLPETVIPMLPREATSRCGLGLQEQSPALTFAIRLSDDGEAELERMFFSRLHVERMTYQSCAAAMNESPLPEISAALQRFKERRLRDGAVMIRLPEVKIRVSGEEVQILPCPVTPERELVANAMLAAGNAVAKYMEKQGGSFPFVTQDPPETEERGETLAAMFQLRRACPAGVCSCRAGRHSGLALEPYSRVTSPLRRYTDLLAHYQIRRLLCGKEPLSFEELDPLLARAESAAALRRKAEKYSNEYWTLVWLSRQKDYETRAVLADKQGERLTFLIPSLAYEYKCRLQTRLRVGDEVTLSLNKADPAAMRSSFFIRATPSEPARESQGETSLEEGQ